MRVRPGARVGAVLATLLSAGLSAGTAQADWPTAGGDHGTVVHVTSLDDSGSGTLRAALLRKEPRRIVFDVGGEIRLKSPLKITSPFVTVAGETAPAPGISLLGDKVHIRTQDVILRGLRVRVGELPGSNPASRDGIAIEPLKGKNAANILIDRCSVSWAIDENIGLWGGSVHNVLIRRTIVAEALRNSIHPKGAHSMGLLVGKGSTNIVIERNLFAHNAHRNPAIDAGASAIIVNNLIYDPIYTGFHIYGKAGEGPTLVSAVGNLVIAGPATKPSLLRSFAHGVNPGSKIYYRDNVAVGVRAFATTEKAGKEQTEPVPFVNDPPVWLDWIRTEPATAVADEVLADVGAQPLDDTDLRIIEEVRSRGGSLRDTPPDPRLQVARPLPKKGG